MESSGLGLAFFLLGLIISVNARFTKDSSCGVSKGCFSDCRSFDGCTYLVTWAQTSTGVDFTLKSEIISSGDQYIAVGFSSDDEMGEDSVTECVMTGGSNFGVYQSYNPDDDSNYRTTNPTLGLSATSGSYTDGILECSFKRTNTSTDPKIYSLLTDWYLFWAIGEYETDENEMEEHDDYGISSKVVDLQSYEDVTEQKKPKVKAHGCLAIIAWVGFTSIGVVMARSFKPMWPHKKWFGMPIWLQVHRALMVGAVVFNLIAVIVVFSGHFSIYGAQAYNAHPVLGIIVTVGSVLNVIGGFIRPGPKHKLRPLFYWSHLIIAITTYILGLVNIGIGLATPDAHVPFETVYVLVAFCVYLVAMEVTLEVVDRMGKSKSGRTDTYNRPVTARNVSVSKIELTAEEDGHASPLHLKEDGSEPYCGRLKTYLLFAHIIIATSFTLGLMIALAAY